MSDGKIRIEADGSLEEGNGCGPVGFPYHGPSQAVSLEGLKRGRRGLHDWRIELLHCAKRFAQSFSQLCCCRVHGSEYMFFAGGPNLLLGQRIACAAIHGLDAENILVAQTRNRAIENGGALSPLANVAGNLRCELRVGRLAHQMEGLLDDLVGDKAEEG